MSKNRYKIMNQQNHISDEEIEKFKNFDALLTESKKIKQKQKYKYQLIGAAIILISVTLFYTIYSVRKSSPLPKTLSQKIKTEDKTVEKEEIEIQENSTTPEISSGMEIDSINEKKVIEKSLKQNKVGNKNSSPQRIKEAPITPAADSFIEAEPKGGYDSLFAFFDRNLKYPAEEANNDVSGSVMVEFYIDAEGDAKNVKIMKGVSSGLDAEAIRLINIMPAWRPAAIEGKNISMRQVLPVNFVLEKK